MKTQPLVAFLLALAMVASACGGGSSATVETADDDTTTDATDSSSESPTGSAVENGATAMAAESPIGAFFADDGGFEAALEEYTVRVNEAITICMAAEGFEFASSNPDVNEIEELQSELTLREWTSEYGYGISTSFDTIAQSQASDPNTEIIFGLSEAEREVWISTLTGGGFGENPTDFNRKPLEEQGCIGEALIETGGQDAIEGIETFSTAYEEGEEALFDRREMIEVVDKWSQCMAQAGFPGYAGPDDPEEDINERLDAVVGPMQSALDELSDEEGQALVAGESLDLEKLPGLDLPALREIQKEEIELAVADLDCYEVEVQETYEPLRDAFENGLLSEYATEFEALKNIGS